MSYNSYYQTENLFGDPYPELIALFESFEDKGSVLDLGCGQGRDALALGRMGYTVLGVDTSKVGIEQMNQVAQAEGLALTGLVADVYAFDDLGNYDFILLDSMFHFAKNDREREINFLQKIITGLAIGSFLVICIQDTGKKVEILKGILDAGQKLMPIHEKEFIYVFEDKESGHKSEMEYRMLVVRK